MPITKREDLKMKDVHMVETYEMGDRLVTPVYDQVVLVLKKGTRHIARHRDGSRYTVLPHAFCSIPESVARQYIDNKDAIILSKKEAQKYIDMARKVSEEANKDIVKYNQEVKDHNEKVRKGQIQEMPWAKEKYVHVENNGPFHHLMREMEKKAHKVKTTKKSVKKED
jgi:hypothetical protein